MIFNKYRKTLTAFVFITLVAAVQRTSAQDGKELHGYNISTVSELKEFFRYTPDRIPLVCGHRGGAVKGYPDFHNWGTAFRLKPSFQPFHRCQQGFTVPRLIPPCKGIKITGYQDFFFCRKRFSLFNNQRYVFLPVF